MKLRQHRLRADGMADLICWLEEGRIKVGQKVTLEDCFDPKLLWTVVEVFSQQEDTQHLKRTFHNNI